jgi:uncharacterized protein (DUF427 family)
MPKAIWNGVVIAESDVTEVVEGNHYFLPDAVEHQHLRESDTTTVCGWKGTASYYTIHIEGEQNVDAAWYYSEPKEEAAHIAGYIAFWKGVEIEH